MVGFYGTLPPVNTGHINSSGNKKMDMNNLPEGVSREGIILTTYLNKIYGKRNFECLSQEEKGDLTYYNMQIGASEYATYTVVDDKVKIVGRVSG